MAMVTQGTELYFIDPEGDVVTKVGCPTNINGLTSPRTQIPTTCLDSLEGESLGGLPEPGEVTITLNFDPTDPTHVRLFELRSEAPPPVLEWVVGMSDGTGVAPTNDSSDWILGTGRSWLEFSGYVADFPLDISLNSVYVSTMAIQRSGAMTLTPATTT
jgi:Phage tail tube, TTP, lambda-like